MEISQYALLLLHVYAGILGICLGLLYDGFRITRIFLGYFEIIDSIHIKFVPFYRLLSFLLYLSFTVENPLMLNTECNEEQHSVNEHLDNSKKQR